ncbi:endospore germination permease [Cohnella lubricantis]|uniref:Endospore germination permease n=1 Tax=Cohnella lubricantis TaxID=2163172 RepID=A0A841T8M0_9BACL|nr:endospore germination permease [Cohnella lubricantis]MBB6677853.1 endospore germination permease [Cohnella lubricantis]MBP2119032.1 spore germination protein [Cohnella lubricantis]
MDKTRQITMIQIAAILVSTIIGVGVLPLPLFAVNALDSGAPLITLAAVLFGFISLLLLSLLGMRFPRQTIIQYSEQIIGKWPARAGSLLVIVFFAVLTSLTAREFGEVVVTSVLKNTPVEVTVIVMLLLATFSTRNDVTVFAYIHYFYFPLILFPALFIVALSLKNADALNLQPIWGNDPQGVIPGALTIAALFQGSFILTSVIPSMRRPQKALLASVVGMVIAGGLYVIIVAATVGVFGAEETKKLLWPTLELAKATSLPANVLERLDAAFLIVWVTAVFTTLLSSYFLTTQSLGLLFRLRDHKLFAFFLLPFVFVLAMLPQNIVQMYTIVRMVGRIGLILTLAYPALLLLVSILRKKRGEPVGEVAQR